LFKELNVKREILFVMHSKKEVSFHFCLLRIFRSCPFLFVLNELWLRSEPIKLYLVGNYIKNQYGHKYPRSFGSVFAILWR